MRRLTTILTLLLLLTAIQAPAQDDTRIAEQRRIVEQLEQKIATEKLEIERLQRNRSASEEQLRLLARQIDKRAQLLNETEKQASLIEGEIGRRDSIATSLEQRLEVYRTQYAEMAREAWRNYSQQNYLTYLFSARDFADMARRLASLREMASLRERRIADIERTTREVSDERRKLAEQRLSLDSVTRKVTSQKRELEQDARTAKSTAKSLSTREKEAIARKRSQEQQLEVAISELRRLSKGNTEGASFSTKTSGLNLPVRGGSVKRYRGNMAEVKGVKGAAVISIYDGKVVDLRRNRITGKYEIYIAHGEYITSYANLGSASVAKGDKVSRNQQIGTIGSQVNVMTMQTEYEMVFGIYPPTAGTEISAENCFKKR